MSNEKTTTSANEDKLVFSCILGEETMMLPEYSRYYEAMNNIHADLSRLNVYRGGSVVERPAGYVFEYRHAARANIDNLAVGNGKVVNVLNNNDPQRDLIITSRDGSVSYQQVKRGYHGNEYSITKEHYPDVTIVIDRGNEEVITYLEKKNMQYIESKTWGKESITYVKMARKEIEIKNFVREKIFKNSIIDNVNSSLKNAPVVAKIYELKDLATSSGSAGLAAAKSGAALAGGISFGKNMYQFMEGDITLGEAVADTVKDTLTSFATGFVSGTGIYAAGAIISKTAIGGMVLGIINDSIFATIGGMAVTMSAAVWPMFVAGMVIGAGYSMFQGIKYKMAKYRNQISQINKVLDLAIKVIKSAYDDLDETINRTYRIWDETMDKGFAGMLEGVKENDFTMFSASLDKILELYHSHVLFHSMEEFDEFFNDDNAVLVL